MPWRKILADIISIVALSLLIWLVGWKIFPALSANIQHKQATRTAIVAATQVFAATRQEIVHLTDAAAAWTETFTLTPSPMATRTPTITLTPAWTRTFTPTPTSTLIPPDCTEIGQEWVSPIDGMTLVCVPAGEFTMGSDSGYDNEFPRHSVFLDAYWIDQTEVTNAQYARCVADGDCTAPSSSKYGDPDYASHPVVYVSWYEAEAYCTWAGRALPTEAQWEKAARGTDERIWPWGNEFDCRKVNVYGSSCDGFSRTAPAGSFPDGASPYGVLDMSGNVWEWVEDWYDGNYYATYPKNNWPANPTGPESGTFRVLRGGSWFYVQSVARVSLRVRNDSDRYDDGGFRCTRGTSP